MDKRKTADLPVYNYNNAFSVKCMNKLSANKTILSLIDILIYEAFQAH